MKKEKDKRKRSWFIPMDLIEKCASYGGEKITWKRKGFLGLFDKNQMRVFYFRNPEKDPCRFGYIAERSIVPKYFTNVIILTHKE